MLPCSGLIGLLYPTTVGPFKQGSHWITPNDSRKPFHHHHLTLTNAFKGINSQAKITVTPTVNRVAPDSLSNIVPRLSTIWNW